MNEMEFHNDSEQWQLCSVFGRRRERENERVLYRAIMHDCATLHTFSVIIIIDFHFVHQYLMNLDFSILKLI